MNRQTFLKKNISGKWPSSSESLELCQWCGESLIPLSLSSSLLDNAPIDTLLETLDSAPRKTMVRQWERHLTPARSVCCCCCCCPMTSPPIYSALLFGALLLLLDDGASACRRVVSVGGVHSCRCCYRWWWCIGISVCLSFFLSSVHTDDSDESVGRSVSTALHWWCCTCRALSSVQCATVLWPEPTNN